MPDSRRILIIDDNEVDRQLYRRLLNQDPEHEYEIIEAVYGDEGLEICRNQEPDCVLLDYHLPDFDGLEFLADLNGMDQENRIAVVMLTGTGNEAIAVDAMKSGAQDYLVKGEFSRNDFLRAVDNAIEKMSLMQALEEHRKQLARSNEELAEFAFTASHDLQAPLRRTKTFCKMLEDKLGGQLDEETQEYMNCIVHCTEQMQALVSGLLEYGRVGTSKRAFALTESAEVVGEAVSNLDDVIKEGGARVKCDDLPPVMADRVQMIQLFQNLINNAVKYHGNKVPKVRVGASIEDGFAKFTVQDNGIGIESKYADQVFTIFKRLHGDDVYSGSGIGLATCKKIVERHGGKIWFDSEPGEGTVFCFTIPIPG